MKTIYKIDLFEEAEKNRENQQIIKVKLPSVSKTISAIDQKEKVVVYYEVETENNETEDYEIAMVGTGHEMKFDSMMSSFLGTVNTQNGDLMWHVYWVYNFSVAKH